MTMLAAIIDACVLIQATPRDTLLRAAEVGLFQPYWSNQILAEVERNLITILEKRGREDSETKVRYLIAELRAQFPEAIVTNHEPLIPTMANHPNDRHVLAAAIASGATIIITDNLRDFPPRSTEPYGIAVVTPDDFLLSLFEREPAAMHSILVQQATEMRQPRSVADLLKALQRGTPRFAEIMRSSIKEKHDR